MNVPTYPPTAWHPYDDEDGGYDSISKIVDNKLNGKTEEEKLKILNMLSKIVDDTELKKDILKMNEPTDWKIFMLCYESNKALEYIQSMR